MRSRSLRLSVFYAGFNSTRMLIGAVHSLYLLSTGVSLRDLALLQMAFSATVLIAEFPTGVIADTLSRRASMLLSCAMVAVFYLLCLGAPDMRLLVASEVSYGLGLCFASGALEAWITDTITSEHPGDHLKINHYGHLRAELTAFGTMISGTLGAVAAAWMTSGFTWIYCGASAAMLALLAAFAAVPEPRAARASSSEPLSARYKETMRGLMECLGSRDGLCFLALGGLLVGAAQILFHYWQPFFLRLAGPGSSPLGLPGGAAGVLGAVFFCYSLARYLFNRFARDRLLKTADPFSIAIGASAVGAICVAALGLIAPHGFARHVALFAVVQGAYSLVETVAEAQFIKAAPANQLASLLSASSMVTRIAGILVLAGLARVVTETNLPTFFALNAALFLGCWCVFAYWRALPIRGQAAVSPANV